MATSDLTQFMEDINEQVLECTICLNRIQLPTSLSCHHSFCLPCLKEWVGKNKGVLNCPTCSRSEPIPQGGLEKLQPNTFLNNLIETMEKYEKRNQTKCVCGSQAKYYCQECRHHLCSSCTSHHKLLPMLANHKLHTVEDVQSMTPQEFTLINPPMCSLHSKELEFYCDECKVPTCMNCLHTDHKEWKGKHTSISISDAFKRFKETTAGLEADTLKYKNKLQGGLDAVIQNDKKLDKIKNDSLRDIDHLMQEIMNIIIEKGEKLKNSINKIYKHNKEVNDKQIRELKLNISDVNTNLSFLHQILKSDEATAMQSSENLTKALKDKIKELPKTEPDDNAQLCFVRNKQQFDLLKQGDIGRIIQMPAENMMLVGPEVVKKDKNNDHNVRTKSKSQRMCRPDVSASGKSINQSPMKIKVEKEGLINTINIKTKKAVLGVVKHEDGCLLVSCLTNIIYKYKVSGECIDKITLPKGVKVWIMYKMRNGNIVFNDSKCIKVCNMDGKVKKSIGQEILHEPCGIHVDESSNIAYVADCGNKSKDTSKCFLFNLDSGQVLKTIKSQDIGYNSKFYDITVKINGNMLVVDFLNDKVLLFDNKAKFLKVIIEKDNLNCPRGIAVDQDDNIIISSFNSLKLFSKDGTFIKQINKDEDGIEDAYQLSIISYHPRQIAVANGDEQNIKIFNY